MFRVNKSIAIFILWYKLRWNLLGSDHYLFTSNSVNLNKESNVNFKLSRSVVNKIIETLSQDELKIKDLTKKIKLDELLVKKHIIIMIKLDILGFREK